MNVDQEGAFVPAHRVVWFGVERPVEGTVFVKPAMPEPIDGTDVAADPEN